MTDHTSISIKPSLLGVVVPFLQTADMECLVTQQAIVELASKLVHYQEEGHALFPDIYIFDDLELISKVLAHFEYYKIGEGEKTVFTMMKGLKKCAPLTGNGWSIYLFRKEASFEYGVFRSEASIVSVSVSETLIDCGSSELKAILIHQVAEKVVEIRNFAAKSLIVDFGSADYVHKTVNETDLLIKAIVSKADNKIKDQMTNFYQKVIGNVLQRGHGTLACVIDSRKKKLPEKLKDGILLLKRIDVAKLINDKENNTDPFTDSKLSGAFSLISGMMLSDGITVFTNDGCVFSYNVFIKHSQKLNKSSTNGGARSRTYQLMCEMVGKDLDAAFIQSQDGKIEFKKNGK